MECERAWRGLVVVCYSGASIVESGDGGFTECIGGVLLLFSQLCLPHLLCAPQRRSFYLQVPLARAANGAKVDEEEALARN